jgi:hypothetical protein
MQTRKLLTAVVLTGLLAACSSGGDKDATPDTTMAPVTTATTGDGHDDHDHSAMVGGLGTSATAEGFTLNVVSFDAASTAEQTMTFTITDDAGAPVSEFEEHHEKPMHLVLVKHDLTGYQHLHPTMGADGIWSVPVAFGSEGFFHIVVDFHSAGKAVVLGTDVQVGKAAMVMASLSEDARTATSGPYTATLVGDTAHEDAAPLKVEFTKDGMPVETVNPYLGANAHMVAFNSATLGYTHLHPNDGFPGGVMTFTAPAMEHGFYKAFLQVDFDGELRLFEFVFAGK